jgi:segregation and condensation protein B
MDGEQNQGQNSSQTRGQTEGQHDGDEMIDDAEEAGEELLPLRALIESLLFVADEPIRVDYLASILGSTVEQVEAALQELASGYDEQRGIRLQFRRDRVQMVTAPEATEVVRRFLGLELDGKLSPAALETLAIVAYRQPVTRAQIEAVRGVGSDSVLRTLVNRGLVEELGRLEQAGRPIIYGSTFEFLQHFGLTSLKELPPLEDEETYEAP